MLKGIKFKDIKVGQVVYKNGKGTRVLAKLTLEEKIIVRYLEDIEGKHATRCYLYSAEDVQVKVENVTIYDLVLCDTLNNEVKRIPYYHVPSMKDISAAISAQCNLRAAYARIETIEYTAK